MISPLQADTITRETFWLIGPVEEILFYYLAAVTVLVFVFGAYQRFSRYAEGSEDPIERLDDLRQRVVSAAKIVGSNEKQFNRDFVGGVMHAFILWGFLTLLIGTTILMIDMDIYRKLTAAFGEKQSFFVGNFYLSYSLVMDAMGFLLIIGLGVALYRRYVTRNERLWDRHTSFEDAYLVWVLFLLGVGGYLVEGIRILGTGFPDFETVSFVGWFVADMLKMAGMTQATAQAVYPLVWWSHALLAFVFIASIPLAKPFHMISSFANVVTRDDKAGTRLPGVPADASPDEIGASSIEDFSWKQLLDHDACTKCGRCSSVCPAKASGRPLDPRNVILDLKQYREDLDAGRTDETAIIADGGSSVIDSETMESCMSCMACMDACPVEIEHVTQFTEMNRRLTESGEMAETVQESMMNMFQNGNSFGDPERKRPDWVEDLAFEVPDAREESVEYLWYVGDYPSYDERNQKVAKSLATLFHRSDISYGILYEDEQNDGNDVRRVGEEGLYEMLVEDNIALFEECEFENVVCTDPHSYNTFKNEYPEFGWNEDNEYGVYHYTQVVQDLVPSLGLTGNELDYTVTYHDPCHLGRFNDEYEAPRSLVQKTGCDLHEMPRNRANSFCCGGGGGGLWMDLEEETKPSEERLREALEDTDAGDSIEKFVVACPMCMTMYEDGRKTGDFEEEIEVVGLSELLAEAVTEGVTASDASVSQSSAPADD